MSREKAIYADEMDFAPKFRPFQTDVSLYHVGKIFGRVSGVSEIIYERNQYEVEDKFYKVFVSIAKLCHSLSLDLGRACKRTLLLNSNAAQVGFTADEVGLNCRLVVVL